MIDRHFTHDFFIAYLEAIMFTEEIASIEPHDIIASHLDCSEFIEKAESLIKDLDPVECGHDFWFTRNGHGVGFWDGKHSQHLGDDLSEIARSFHEFNIDKPQENEE